MSKLMSNVFVENEWYGPAYGNAEDVPADIAAKIPNPKAWQEGDVPLAPAEDDDDQGERSGSGDAGPPTIPRPRPRRSGTGK